MRRRERFEGSGTPFEGDRTVWVRSIPDGAQLRSAVLTVTPVAAPGAPPFDEVITFVGGVGTWGATQVRSDATVPRWVEIDFHARRTLAAIRGVDLEGAAMQVDLGGVYVQLNDVGAVKIPNEGTLFALAADGLVPGLTVAKFKLTHPTKPLAVSRLTFRSTPSNVTARFGSQPSFWARPGEFSTPQASPDVAKALQDALSTVEVDGGFYRLPLVVHSDTVCRLDIELDVEFVLARSVLPGGLSEANLVYDLAGVPRADAAALSVAVPAGARLVPSALPARVSGAFEKSRVAYGPVGPVDPLGTLAVTPAESLARPITVPDDLVVTAVDLLLGATTPTAVLRVDLVDDTDGKPFNAPLLPRPLELRLDRDLVGDATWVSAPLPAPFGLLAGRRYWWTVQAESGQASWSATGTPARPDTQRSVDGGLSWRSAPVAGVGVEGLMRLRTVPAEFTMPIELAVGEGSAARRVSLERFAPLGRVEVDLNADEIIDGVNEVLAASTSGAGCPTGEHLRNTDFSSWRRTADLPTGTREIDLGHRARRIAVAADGCVAFVAGGAETDGEVAVQVRALDVFADLAGPWFTATTVRHTIDGVAASPDGGHGYVLLDGADDPIVRAHDPATGRTAESVLGGVGGAVGLAAAPDGALLYVAADRTFGAHGEGPGLIALDAAAVRAGGMATAGPAAVLDDTPVTFAVSPDGATVWVVVSEGELGTAAVVAIDTAGMASTGRRIPLGARRAGRCALSRGGGTLAVVHPGDAQLSVVDLAAGTVTVVELTAAGDDPQPSAVAVSADGGYGFVALRNAGAVALVDLRAGRVLRRVPVGSQPLDCAITPDGERVLVADGAGAGQAAMTVLPIGALLPEDWTVTAGRVRPWCLPPGGRIAALGVLPFEAAAAGTATATAALAQVAAVRGSCRYEFGFLGLASAEGATAEVHWMGPGCAGMRVDTVAIQAIPAQERRAVGPVELELEPHHTSVQAPAGAEQAEIRFRSPAGVLAGVDRVGLRATANVVVNGGFGRDADVLVGWQVAPAEATGFGATAAADGVHLVNAGSGPVTLTQDVDVRGGRDHRLEVDATATAGPPAAVAVSWSAPAVGAGLAVALPVAGPARQVVVGRAPEVATAAQVRLELPAGAAVGVRRIALQVVDATAVPLVFVAQSVGELTVSDWQVSYDVDETPQAAPPPAAGLCRPGRPEPVPGEDGSDCCYCPTCEGEHPLDGVREVVTGSGLTATRGRCGHCGSEVVVPGRQGETGPAEPPATSAVQVGRSAHRPGADLADLLATTRTVRPPAPALAEVHGIGERRAVLLNRIGIIGLPDLAAAAPGLLAALPGVSVAMARNWIAEGRQIDRRRARDASARACDP